MNIPQEPWNDYRNAMWLFYRDKGIGGAVAFEQIAYRSTKEKRCHSCGDYATFYSSPTPFSWIKSTGYYLCDECKGYESA